MGLHQQGLGEEGMDDLGVAGAAERSDPDGEGGRGVEEVHLEGILNAVVMKTTNEAAESVNAPIKRIKTTTCGYRNRERFHNAILFLLGGLDLYPRPASTHTES